MKTTFLSLISAIFLAASLTKAAGDIDVKQCLEDRDRVQFMLKYQKGCGGKEKNPTLCFADASIFFSGAVPNFDARKTYLPSEMSKPELAGVVSDLGLNSFYGYALLYAYTWYLDGKASYDVGKGLFSGVRRKTIKPFLQGIKQGGAKVGAAWGLFFAAGAGVYKVAKNAYQCPGNWVNRFSRNTEDHLQMISDSIYGRESSRARRAAERLKGLSPEQMIECAQNAFPSKELEKNLFAAVASHSSFEQSIRSVRHSTPMQKSVAIATCGYLRYAAERANQLYQFSKCIELGPCHFAPSIGAMAPGSCLDFRSSISISRTFMQSVVATPQVCRRMVYGE